MGVQEDSAGVRHLTDLRTAGLTHVHLLPSYDYGSVPERAEDQQTPEASLNLPLLLYFLRSRSYNTESCEATENLSQPTCSLTLLMYICKTAGMSTFRKSLPAQTARGLLSAELSMKGLGHCYNGVQCR
jgi:hypothetical protein